MIRLVLIAVCLALLASSCGSSPAEQDAASIPSVEITLPPPDLDVCRADAEPGIELTRLAMELSDGVPPVDLIGGRWTSTLAEGQPELVELLDEVNTRVRECSTADALAVVVIDLADEATPDSLESTIIWLDTFAPLITVARDVDPFDTAEWVEAASGRQPDPPDALDLGAIDSCDAITDGLADQISGFHEVWDNQSPVDLASDPPSLDLGNAVQAARLRAAELGCNLFTLSSQALLALTTRSSSGFVGRAQRLTYGEWILATMVGPHLANPDEDVFAEPVGGPEGIAGFTITDRSDGARAEVVLTV